MKGKLTVICWSVFKTLTDTSRPSCYRLFNIYNRRLDISRLIGYDSAEVQVIFMNLSTITGISYQREVTSQYGPEQVGVPFSPSPSCHTWKRDIKVKKDFRSICAPPSGIKSYESKRFVDINLGMDDGDVVQESKPGGFCFRMGSFNSEKPGHLRGCVPSASGV